MFSINLIVSNRATEMEGRKIREILYVVVKNVMPVDDKAPPEADG